MDAKNYGFLATILLLISVIPVANAQTSDIAIQKSVDVIINSAGDVHAIHVVARSDLPKQIELIDGTVSNLSVTNEQGKAIQFETRDNEIVIISSQGDSIVEYDLGEALFQIDKTWTWDFRYLQSTTFIFPKEIDLVFVNDGPIYLDDKKGITCHGCQMTLEYPINEPKILKNVKWEDREFNVEIKSHSNIDEFIFDQRSKSITFDVSEKDRFITIVVPLELLWEPYTVFLDNKKILFYEYNNNGTHVWLNMKPDVGKITVMGTTVIPEFPIIAPLAIGFLMILAMPLVRKFNLR